MDSKQILLNIPRIKEENKNTYNREFKAFEKYVGTKNYKNLLINDKINFLERNNPKVGFVLKKINDRSYRTLLNTKLVAVYNELIKPFLTEKTKYLNTTPTNIKNNLSLFFEAQKGYDSISNVSSILNFHTIFLNYFGVYFIPLVSKQHLYIHQEIYSITSSIYSENESIFEYTKDYIDKYDIEFVRKHKPLDIVFDDKDIEILELLKNVFNNLIKKLQKKGVTSNNKDCIILTYGSYTNFNINPEISYNDIDIYMNNPLSLLVSFLVVIKVTLNIDVDIFKIPYIIGHVSLRYKNVHFTDCLYMDDKTISEVPSVIIKEITFVHPLIQVLNLFRMMSEPRRMAALSETEEKRLNTEKKMASLLQYCCETYSIDITKDLTSFDVNFETFQDSFLINLTDVFKHVKGYDNIKEYLEFDYLMISRYAPSLFLDFLKDKNPIIRKQWFALFNEIVVEFHNKKPISNSKNKKLLKKLNKLVIKEEELVFDRVSNITNNENTIDLIKNNNVMLMSNFTTEFYMKVTKEKSGIIKKYEMTNITKETCLSSFILSQVLNYFDNDEMVKFYLLFLLSFIKNNNKDGEKEKELMLLANQNGSESDMYISSLGKNKLEGRHETFFLSPYPRLKNLFFYKKQDKTIYKNYQEFLDVTTYN